MNYKHYTRLEGSTFLNFDIISYETEIWGVKVNSESDFNENSLKKLNKIWIKKKAFLFLFNPYSMVQNLKNILK